MNTRQGCLVVALMVALAACSDSASPAPSIAGTWNLTSFSDSGTVGVTTGTMSFADGGGWSVLGTVTYPGEPLDSLIASGTWVQNGVALTLSVTGGTTGIWDLAFTGDQVTMTGRPPNFTIITLTRP